MCVSNVSLELFRALPLFGGRKSVELVVGKAGLFFVFELSSMGLERIIADL